MTLTEKDSGGSFDLAASSTLTLRLKENPTTGYRWSVESSGGLRLAGNEQEHGSTAGGGGVHVFRFSVPADGTHELRLRHWREWEGEGSITDRFSATINVK